MYNIHTYTQVVFVCKLVQFVYRFNVCPVEQFYDSGTRVYMIRNPLFEVRTGPGQNLTLIYVGFSIGKAHEGARIV